MDVFHVFKLYKWYQTARSNTNLDVFYIMMAKWLSTGLFNWNVQNDGYPKKDFPSDSVYQNQPNLTKFYLVFCFSVSKILSRYYLLISSIRKKGGN